MLRYKVTTSARDAEGNLTYSGKTYGVRFERGIAFFDDVTIDKKLGLTAEEIAVKMEKDFGYAVERLNMDGTPYVAENVQPLAGVTPTQAGDWQPNKKAG